MKFIFYLALFSIAGKINSQTVQKIKFQKSNNFIYFFSKNVIADSVITKRDDLFYLIIPDSLKKNISVFVENGRFLKTANDSLVKLSYMPGLKYELQYLAKEDTAKTLSEKAEKKLFAVSLINGASVYPKNKIAVQIFNKKEEKVILENIFFTGIRFCG